MKKKKNQSEKRKRRFVCAKEDKQILPRPNAQEKKKEKGTVTKTGFKVGGCGSKGVVQDGSAAFSRCGQ